MRAVDMFEAVRYDVRLHGARFISLEFGLVGLGAVGLTAVELLHVPHSALSLTAALWFAGFALNCLAVVLLVRQTARTGLTSSVPDRWLRLYALELVVLLLVPCAVTLISLLERRTRPQG